MEIPQMKFNNYIIETMNYFNLIKRRKIISKKLQKESIIVQDESMKVLAEFEKLLEKRKS